MAIRQSALENVGMTPGFWQGKRVLLTGHTGFKGSWLSLWLHTLGAHVTGYARAPSTQPNLFDLAHVSDHVTSILGDIRDLERIKQVVTEVKPDIIFHLAAQPLVRYGYQHPVETYETNVLGTVHLLEAMRLSETARVFVNVTTDKCYENKEWHWGYREVDPMGGYDPYSSSKGCSELVTAAYRHSYFNGKASEKQPKGVASVRAGNIMGGGDWSKDRLVPDIMTALMAGQKPVIRFPAAIRPWQHVLEPLHGYLLLAERLMDSPHEYAQAWNLGPYDKDCQSVSHIVDYLCAAFGEGHCWALSTEEHPHEATFLKLDISKSTSLLRWHPHWSLHEALKATVAWYQAWQRGKDALTLTLQQIELYTQQLETPYA